jgi:hypothetical protein
VEELLCLIARLVERFWWECSRGGVMMMGIHSVQLVLLFLRWVAFKAGIPSPGEEKQALVVIGFFGMLERGAENGIMACTTNTYVVIRGLVPYKQTMR